MVISLGGIRGARLVCREQRCGFHVRGSRLGAGLGSARLPPGRAEQTMGALTSPYVSCLAPTAPWMLLMPEGGPATREVPVSTMAWQPPLHATSWLFTMMLVGGDRQSMGPLNNQLDLSDVFKLFLIRLKAGEPKALPLGLSLLGVCNARWYHSPIAHMGTEAPNTAQWLGPTELNKSSSRTIILLYSSPGTYPRAQALCKRRTSLCPRHKAPTF